MSFASVQKSLDNSILHCWTWPVFVRRHLVPSWIWRQHYAARHLCKRICWSWPILVQRAHRLPTIFLVCSTTGTERLHWIVSVAACKEKKYQKNSLNPFKSGVRSMHSKVQEQRPRNLHAMWRITPVWNAQCVPWNCCTQHYDCVQKQQFQRVFGYIMENIRTCLPRY